MKKTILTLMMFLLIAVKTNGDYYSISNLKLIVAYDQKTEVQQKESLKITYPEKEKFLTNHRILTIYIEGNDEFCANEFIVADSKGGINIVLMLFTARNEWIKDYCHQVKGFTWGLLFIPLGRSKLDFNFRNIKGMMDIGVEYQT